MAKTADRVKETTSTTGTGSYTLGGAFARHIAFSAVVPSIDGVSVYYGVEDSSTGFEIGRGTYSAGPNTLSRDSIIMSSNGGAAVSWGAGAKTIWINAPAELLRNVSGAVAGNAVARWDGADGLLKTSPATLTDAGVMTGASSLVGGTADNDTLTLQATSNSGNGDVFIKTGPSQTAIQIHGLAGAPSATFTMDTVDQNASSAGDPYYQIANAGTGGAKFVVDAGSAGDPVLNFQITNSHSWTLGVDNSASDSWKLSTGGDLGTNDRLVIDTDATLTTISLTRMTIGGALAFTAAGSKIIPGATSFVVRNNADTQDNLIALDSGDTTVRGALTVTGAAIGTGSASNLSFSTSGGTQLRVMHVAGATNFLTVGGSPGSLPKISTNAGGLQIVAMSGSVDMQVEGFSSIRYTGTTLTPGDDNGQDLGGASSASWRTAYIGTGIHSGGARNLLLSTGGGAQVRVEHVASATRSVTLAGSAAGNPTIATSAGNLAITPAVVLADSLIFSATASKIIPGATSIALRNSADSANNLLVTDAGDVTVRNNLILASAASRIIPGATSVSLRNNANSLDNLIVTDAGNVTIRGTFTVSTLTIGSIPFVGTAGLLTQDNARLFWDDAADILKLRTQNTPTNASLIVPNAVIAGSGVNQGWQTVRTGSPSVGGAHNVLSSTRGADVNSYTSLILDDGIGTLAFYGTDGTQFEPAGLILVQVDNTPTTGLMYGRFVFSVANGTGSNQVTEAMRIQRTQRMTLGGPVATPAFEVIPVASQNRWVTVTGANGGNPILNVTGGDLAVTPNMAIAGRIGVGGQAVSASTALALPASTTGISSLRIPHGAAPSAPVNGDMWTDTTAIFIRINGVTISFSSGAGDHGGLTGLGDDDHPQYPLIAGRAGGQTLAGGNAASETLTLRATSHATGGDIIFEAEPAEIQFRVLATSGADRYIRVTGSAGGNPTIDTTAGNLAVTPSMTMAGSLFMTTPASKLIPGATSFAVRDTTDTNDNLLVTDVGDVTVRGKLKLFPAVATIIPGATSVAFRDTADTVNNFSITDAGNATLRGTLAMSLAASRIIPGVSSFAIRDTANSADNLIVTDAGNATIRGTLSLAPAASRIIPGGTSLALRNNANSADNLLVTDAGNVTVRDGFTVAAGNLTVSAGTIGLSTDVILARDAANILAQRNGTNAQAFHIYNTFTDASNYERLNLHWLSNIATIESAAAGTGTQRVLSFATNGAHRWQILTTGHFVAPTDNTLDIGASGATRPRTIYVGTRAIIGDDQATGHGLQVVSGTGAMLYASAAANASSSPGTNWIRSLKNTVTVFVGDNDGTSGYASTEYSGAIRFNGAAVAWGDLAYFPNGGSTGHFRFYIDATTVGTGNANATVGVGTLKVTTSVVTPLVGTGAAASLDFSTSGGVQFRVIHIASAVNIGTVSGSAAGNAVLYGADGSDANINVLYGSKGTGFISFRTNGNATEQFRVNHIASAVNYIHVQGAATTGTPGIRAAGSDTNIPLVLSSQGTGGVQFQTGAFTALQALVGHTASADRHLTFTGSNGGNPTISVSAGALAITPDVVFAGATIVQNSQSAAYTLVAADANKHLLHPSADTTARTFTIPANSSVAYAVGTAVTFVNQNAAGALTIAITTDTMRLAGPGTTGSRTLAANGIATALKITSTEWIISGTGLT